MPYQQNALMFVFFSSFVLNLRTAPDTPGNVLIERLAVLALSNCSLAMPGFIVLASSPKHCERPLEQLGLNKTAALFQRLLCPA
jgi:hypothetical protein